MSETTIAMSMVSVEFSGGGLDEMREAARTYARQGNLKILDGRIKGEGADTRLVAGYTSRREGK